MFARYILPPNSTDIDFSVYEYSPGNFRLEPLKGKDLEALQQAAMTVIRGVFDGQGSGADVLKEVRRVTEAVKNMLPRMMDEEIEDKDFLDFILHAVVAHHRLPEARRKAREARIASVIERTLKNSNAASHMKGVCELIKMMAVAVPDPLLEFEVSHQTIVEFRNTCATDASVCSHLLGDVYLPFMSRKEALKKAGIHGDVWSFLVAAFLTIEPAQRPALVATVKGLLEKNRAGSIALMNQWIARNKRVVPSTFLIPTLIDALKQFLQLEDGDLRGEDEIDAYIRTRAEMQLEAIEMQLANVSIQAVIDGVPLGKAYEDEVKRRLAEWDNEMAVAENEIQVADLQAQAANPASSAAQTDADVAPVHTWSVSRLLNWIEGPISERPIQRRAIQQRQREQRQARQARQMRPTPAGVQPASAAATARETPSAEPEGLTDIGDDDIDLVVDAALQTAADFHLRDLDDLLHLAEELKLPPTVTGACRQSREAMQKIVRPRERLDETVICQALSRAEAAIAALRREVKTAQIDDRRRRRFLDALDKALNAEDMVRGKRHGGVIECPMPRELWGWVNDEFHGQWVAGAQHLVINGHPTPLRANEALALYVTGSSQSGFAFDISVHLWQRRADRSSGPCLDLSGRRHMNQQDWFDTFIPCAVLHVPLGK